MAGGLGKRFWPLSRRTRPKHLLPVVGAQTMLRLTAERLATLVGWDHVLVVTNLEQAAEVRAQLPDLSPTQVVAEPMGRNTAACVGLGLRWLELHGHRRSFAGFFPSDHVVRDLTGFRRCVERGWDLADGGSIVAFGIAPDRPETGYGYIRAGSPLNEGVIPRAFAVRSFHEKPDRVRAEQWVSSGEYFWNSGMFVARVEVLWQELADCLPETARTLIDLGGSLTDDSLEAQRERYVSLRGVSIDEGVMERSRRMAVVESSFGWDDVGSWEAASHYWPISDADNRVLGADVAMVDCDGCRVRSDGMLVALVGMHDVVVVQTGDAVLVCPRNRAQDVKALVEKLEKETAGRYL